jgi:hypothetical protein
MDSCSNKIYRDIGSALRSITENVAKRPKKEFALNVGNGPFLVVTAVRSGGKLTFIDTRVESYDTTTHSKEIDRKRTLDHVPEWIRTNCTAEDLIKFYKSETLYYSAFGTMGRSRNMVISMYIQTDDNEIQFSYRYVNIQNFSQKGSESVFIMPKTSKE